METKKKVFEMTIKDIVMHTKFNENLRKLLNELSIRNAHYGYNIKANPYDKLKKRGLLTAESIMVLYPAAIEKVLNKNDFPSSERKLITDIGNTVLRKTFYELQEAENNEQVQP